jgi:hypothetical protein
MPRRNNNRRRRRGPRLQRNLINQHFVTDLSVTQNANSDSSGVCSGVILFNPALTFNSTPLVDWSRFIEIFSAVRLIHVKVQFTRSFNSLEETKSTGFVPMCFGSVPVGTPSAPSSIAEVADNQDSKLWNVTDDTSPGGLTMNYVARPRRAFANVNDPVPSGASSVGCAGGIRFYGSNFPTEVTILFMLIRMRLEFMGRV